MAIITTNEVKTLLQITATATDSLIDTLIPVVTSDVHEYTNNYFQNYKTKIESGTFVFDASLKTLTSDYDFAEDYGYATGQDVIISGSLKNNGIHTISSVSDNVITFVATSISTIADEDSNARTTIVKMEYPEALKLVVARMINYYLQENKDNVKSESISRYSVTYANDSMVNGYPKSIISGLNRWKRVTFK